VGKNRKMSGVERRGFIIQRLKESNGPITGQQLAEETGVSRQVIVTDIALLRTSNEPIIATSQGYLFHQFVSNDHFIRKVVVCNHPPERTREELEMIVDCGVSIIDVSVEHPYYGDLTGSLMIKSRYDVDQFVHAFSKKDANLLSILTGGIHLHTLEADSTEKMNAATDRLQQAGILVTEDNA